MWLRQEMLPDGLPPPHQLSYRFKEQNILSAPYTTVGGIVTHPMAYSSSYMSKKILLIQKNTYTVTGHIRYRACVF
jgi:hypothetical protein